MNPLRMMLLACATILPMVTASHAADQILAGAITARSGQKLEGVTVSAKREGSTITTSVYTDAAGAYVFPPLPAGKYRLWAQALGFETSMSAVDLTAAWRQNFTLQEIAEAARAVWTLYDLPLNPDAGIGTQYNPNDGPDWTLGTTSKLGELPHDGGMGFDGTIYFTSNNPNRSVTIGKVDPRTGAVKFLKADAGNGRAATAHGLVRDRDGNFWFDVNPGRRALGKLDVATEKISIYQTPADMSPLGGAVTMDVDGKGKIWASTPRGAVRFDPVTERFSEFKSIIPVENAKGSGLTYGAAGDRDGKGWSAL